MSGSINKPPISERPLRNFFAAMALLISIFMLIAFFSFWVALNVQRPQFESDYSSLFITPLTNVKLSEFSRNHGHNHFFVESISGNLVLRQDRGFQKIDWQKTPFVPNGKPWISSCYYQCHDRYLTRCNGDVWVYADPTFSQAFVVEDYHGYESVSATAIKPLFAKIFSNSFDVLNFPDFYTKGKEIYFEVISPKDLAPVAPKLVLQTSLSFEKIDPNPVISGDKFPPRHKNQDWMTSCFYHSPLSLSPTDHHEIWVFFNKDTTHAFVIAKDKQLGSKITN